MQKRQWGNVMSSDDSKLSPLGRSAEKVLKKQLSKIENDMESTEPKYTLTDFMKVMDRVLKLESIRMRSSDDDEGNFFNRKGAEDE